MLPFEFTVPGQPVSHQTRNRAKLADWSRFVRTWASLHWGLKVPVTEAVKLTVTYFHEGAEIRLDNDNMLKPIQDSLNGIIYVDDRQVTDTVVRKASIDDSFHVRGTSMLLLEAFARGDPFVHIVVEHAPSHEELLGGVP